MTEPTANPQPSHLMEFLLALLSPLLTAGSLTDIRLARLAAQEAIAAYKAQGQHELVTIAQILAFALTALDNLRLSMPPELSLSMKLKLRGNANALNRAARDNTQTLEKARRATQPMEASLAEQSAMAGWEQPPTPPNPETDNQPPAPEAAPTATQHQNRLHWANAMKTAAARLQASTATAPPARRKANLMWIEALTGVASDLSQGKGAAATPGMSKAELLRTTLMAGGPGFPAHLAISGKRSRS